MTYHSQNDEAEFLLNYFGSYKGTILDVGSNDGISYSNSYDLIRAGWKAQCLEPGAVCTDLINLYRDNANVFIHNYGIGERDEVVRFWESGAHIPYGEDRGLVSTTIASETDRWRKAGVEFIETSIKLVTFKTFWDNIGNVPLDAISIDVEGQDAQVLKQIDLDEVGCKCLIIEWNGNPDLWNLFNDYCDSFGIGLKVQNNENLIYTRN